MRISWQTFQRAWSEVFGNAGVHKRRVTFTCDGSMVRFPTTFNIPEDFGRFELEAYKARCIFINVMIAKRKLLDENIKRAHQHYGRCGSGMTGERS